MISVSPFPTTLRPRGMYLFRSWTTCEVLVRQSQLFILSITVAHRGLHYVTLPVAWGLQFLQVGRRLVSLH